MFQDFEDIDGLCIWVNKMKKNKINKKQSLAKMLLEKESCLDFIVLWILRYSVHALY